MHCSEWCLESLWSCDCCDRGHWLPFYLKRHLEQTPPFIPCWFSRCWPLVVVFERLTEWQSKHERSVSCSLLSPVCLTQLVSCKVCWPVFTRLPALKTTLDKRHTGSSQNNRPHQHPDTLPVRKLPDDLKELSSNHDKLSFWSHQTSTATCDSQVGRVGWITKTEDVTLLQKRSTVVHRRSQGQSLHWSCWFW